MPGGKDDGLRTSGFTSLPVDADLVAGISRVARRLVSRSPKRSDFRTRFSGLPTPPGPERKHVVTVPIGYGGGMPDAAKETDPCSVTSITWC